MYYQKITKSDIANGEGIRVTLWVSGCEHHCDGCHNTQTWSTESGLPFDYDAYVKILDSLDRPWIAGLTLSGGDPLHPDNIYTIVGLVRSVKRAFPNKTIWCYTGYTLDELWKRLDYDSCLSEVMSHIDILVDGKYQKDLRDVSYPWAGSSNQRIWANVNGEWVQSKYDKEYREKCNARGI